jgi:hypothetical protein
MGFRKKTRSKRKSLAGRHNQSGKQAGKKGSGRRIPTIFNKDKLPEGMEFWRANEAEHLVDFIPFEAGSDMPLDEANRPIVEEGELAYFIPLFVHYNVGSMKEPIVCPYENFNQPCPICEYIGNNFLPKKEWQAIKPGHRVVYLVWSHDSIEDEKKGVQIWEASVYGVHQHLEDAARKPKGGGSINFSDIDTGKNVFFEREGKGHTDTRYKRFSFTDRDDPELPDTIVDQVDDFSLDSVIKMHPTYEYIASIFKPISEDAEESEGEEPDWDDDDEATSGDQESDRNDDEDTPPKRRKRRRSKSDEEVPF